MFSRLISEDHGQDLIEYSLLAAFIALACIFAITAVGTQLNAAYDTFAGQVSAAAATIGS